MKIKFITALFLLFAFCCFSQEKDILTNPKLLSNFLAKQNVWGEPLVIGHTTKGKKIHAYYYNKGGTVKR